MSEQNQDQANDYDLIEEESPGDDGSNLWLMTYGDMMTLLFAFFVLLFAMSETEMKDFAQLLESLKKAIGKQEVPEAGTREGLEMLDVEAEAQPEAIDELGAMVRKELDEFLSEAEEFIMKNKLAGQVQIKQDRRGVVITISDLVLFPPGKANFNPEGTDILEKISELIEQFDYKVNVEGHTDNVPINTELFPSNWELSANRASKIVRFFIENGIFPTRLSAEGFAEYKPIAPNDTPEGRAKNRRVEIVYERGDIERSIAKILGEEAESD